MSALQTSAPTRKPRAPGPGSWRVLEWAARLGVAGVEPLQVGLDLHPTTLRSHVRRLESHGFVVRHRAHGGHVGRGTVTVTARGLQLAEARGVDGVVQRNRMEHELAMNVGHETSVSWVAAWAEVRGWSWMGPGEMRLDQQPWSSPVADGRRHRPDLGLVTGDRRRIAVEVELARKRPSRLDEILKGYKRRVEDGAIDYVSYVAGTDKLAVFVREHARDVGLRAIDVGLLEPIVDQAREGRVGEVA